MNERDINRDINFRLREILLEESSSVSNDISLVKILVKIIYLNLPSLEKKELNLIMDEKSFEVKNVY